MSIINLTHFYANYFCGLCEGQVSIKPFIFKGGFDNNPSLLGPMWILRLHDIYLNETYVWRLFLTNILIGQQQKML